MKAIGFCTTLLICSLCLHCSKENSIDSVEILYQAKASINVESIVHDKVSYDEIMGYDSSNFTLLLSADAANRIKDYFFPSGGLPFTLQVLGEPLYTGIFFPAYSENAPYGIYINPYPSGNSFVIMYEDEIGDSENNVTDNRNDDRLIKILEHDHKLFSIYK